MQLKKIYIECSPLQINDQDLLEVDFQSRLNYEHEHAKLQNASVL